MRHVRYYSGRILCAPAAGADWHVISGESAVKNALKNLLAFIVTVFFGLIAGSALMTIETVETLEADVKRRIERHRSSGT